MNIEIERKFLVKNTNYRTESKRSSHIIQGFLNNHKKRVVRVRLMDEKGFITIKGKSTKNGLQRYEWEKEIPMEEAMELMKLVEKPILEKTRYFVYFKKHLFEVDEFHGANQGLVVAEIELSEAEEKFDSPPWLGKEVTGKKKYYNAKLFKKPFNSWRKKTSK